MKETAAMAFKDWLGLALAGIGIGFPMHQFFGGMFLALAGASLARHRMPEQDEAEMWAVLLGAGLLAVIAAILAPIWMPKVPVQLAMGMAGFFSRYITRMALRAAGRFEERSADVADRIIDRVLPQTDEADK